MRSRTIKLREIRDRDSPYPWYDYPYNYGYFEIRRGRRTLLNDLDRIAGARRDELDRDDLRLATWMLRRGFLEYEQEADGTITFYYSGKLLNS